MALKLSRTLILALIFHAISARTQKAVQDYQNERQHIIEAELSRTVGGSITLSSDEIKANDIIMKLKKQELDDGFKNSTKFYTSWHFFEQKDNIRKSKLHQIIKKMPKGAALHVHTSMSMAAEYMVNLTYTDNLYACYDDGQMHDIMFSIAMPQRPCPSKWQLMNDLRYTSGDVERFDNELAKLFTVHEDDHIERDLDKVWKKFNSVNKYLTHMLAYRPVREQHFYDLLQKFYNDKVMYIEVRSSLAKLHELDGRKHDRFEIVRMYQRVAKRFAEEHEDFIGIKFIISAFRGDDIESIQAYLDLAKEAKQKMPDTVAGFDLVGQEDKGRPLLDFLQPLIEAQNDLDYYFHGGETNWYGMPTDENLVDALLLGTKRIGHGYALAKHPVLLEFVKSRNIAVEVNVISNNVLALVSDMRNHPLAVYLANGLPVVLSSDDPGVWGAEPMSDDFYIAFQCVASGKADLRMLKQLAINSIRYSALSSRQKTVAFRIFQKQWREFICYVLDNCS